MADIDAAYGPDLYERDEYAWIEQQIQALSNADWQRVDRLHLIEYLTDMAKRERRELRSQLIVLIVHLLKVRFQPQRLTRSWVTTTIEQQQEIEAIIEGMPSLGRQADEILRNAYPAAIHRAAAETGLPQSRFPAESPWSVAEALAFDPPEPAPRGRRHA